MLNFKRLTPRKKNTLGRVLLGSLVGTLILFGCSNLEDQPKLAEPYDASPNFDTAAREILPEAVPVGHLNEDEHFYNGTVDGELAETFPIEITQDVIEEGQTTFEDFCTPCHGYSGDADGIVVREGFPQPPSYHSEELRNAPVGRLFQQITNGGENMYSYASRVKPEERWAVVAYIKALQLSRDANLDNLPSDIRAQFGE